MESKPKRLMFPYPGSKWTLAPKYVKLFPSHSIYVVPFVGSAAEFAVKEPSKREVVNDIDGNVYSVFAVLRDKRLFKELIYLLRNTTNDRRHYYECHDRLRFEKNLSILDRAYNFLSIANLGYQGVHPTETRSYSCGLLKKASRLRTLIPALKAWRNRMRNVECENRDAFEIIDIYDSDKTLFIMDPPYHESTRRSHIYAHDNFDHRKFLKQIQRLKGKAFVCGYENGLYDVQLQGWRKIVFPTTKSIGGRAPRTEIAWLNYDINGQKIKQDFGLIKAFERLPA